MKNSAPFPRVPIKRFLAITVSAAVLLCCLIAEDETTQSNSKPSVCDSLTITGKYTPLVFDWPHYELQKKGDKTADIKKGAEKTRLKIQALEKLISQDLSDKQLVDPVETRNSVAQLQSKLSEIESEFKAFRAIWFDQYKALRGKVIGPKNPTRMARNPTTKLTIKNNGNQNISGTIIADSETQISRSNYNVEGVIKSPELNEVKKFNIPSGSSFELPVKLHSNYGSVNFKVDYKVGEASCSLKYNLEASGPWEYSEDSKSGLRSEVYEHFLSAAHTNIAWLTEISKIGQASEDSTRNAQSWVKKQEDRFKNLSKVKGTAVATKDVNFILSDWASAKHGANSLENRIDKWNKENHSVYLDHSSSINATHKQVQAAAETFPEKGSVDIQEEEHAVDWNAIFARAALQAWGKRK